MNSLKKEAAKIGQAAKTAFVKTLYITIKVNFSLFSRL